MRLQSSCWPGLQSPGGTEESASSSLTWPVADGFSSLPRGPLNRAAQYRAAGFPSASGEKRRGRGVRGKRRVRPSQKPVFHDLVLEVTWHAITSLFCWPQRPALVPCGRSYTGIPVNTRRQGLLRAVLWASHHFTLWH